MPSMRLAAPAGAPAPKRISILGTRGLPSAHSGFESFIARLAPYLVARGWDVAVYCQDETGAGASEWNGVRLVQIPVSHTDALGSLLFDAKSAWRAAGEDRLLLTMGYNTAILAALWRLRGRRNIFNMDGIEWQRAKWSRLVRVWFYLNDWLGCLLGNHLIADHPAIASHLGTRVPAAKITTIPYCADPVPDANPGVLARFGLEPDRYALMVCRPEPENSVLEIVRAFSARRRGQKLLVLGNYRLEHPFQGAVRAAAGDEVVFAGAIFEPDIVGALRRFTRVYVHGHQVGGTNPSLVEALAAPAPILARDNRFNRWVAGPAAAYFADEDDCVLAFDRILAAAPAELQAARDASAARWAEAFTPDHVLDAYAALLERWVA